MAQPNFVKLSDLIESMETKMQVKYIKLLRDAAKEGLIDALPIEKTFTVKTSVYRDLMAPDDKAFQDWHRQALKQLELTTMRGAAGIAYEDDITSGKIDFKARAEEFRRSLKKRKKRGKRLTPGEAVSDVDEPRAKPLKATKAAAGAAAVGAAEGVSSGSQGEEEAGAVAGAGVARE